ERQKRRRRGGEWGRLIAGLIGRENQGPVLSGFGQRDLVLSVGIGDGEISTEGPNRSPQQVDIGLGGRAANSVDWKPGRPFAGRGKDENAGSRIGMAVTAGGDVRHPPDESRGALPCCCRDVLYRLWLMLCVRGIVGYGERGIRGDCERAEEPSAS